MPWRPTNLDDSKKRPTALAVDVGGVIRAFLLIFLFFSFSLSLSLSLSERA